MRVASTITSESKQCMTVNKQADISLRRIRIVKETIAIDFDQRAISVQIRYVCDGVSKVMLVVSGALF